VESSLQGKTALVTGADSRTGKRTAIGLAKLGATVVLVTPDRGHGLVLRQAIRRESGNDAVELLPGDVSMQRDVHRIAEGFRERHDRLHLLIHGASVCYPEREVTEDGIERTFATAYLSTFLLTSLLLDELRAAAPSRVVTVASRAHRQVSIDFDDLQSEQDYSAAKAFAQAQLATILFTYELASRLDGTGVTVNCVAPNAVESGRATGALGRLIAPLRRTPRRGAKTLLRVAAAPELENVSCEYFSPRGSEQRTSAETYDPAVAAQLWEESERLVGVMVG
jgi:NAD(P)-dependent dehydrogenase (short-subunit alcohol dehydrogenase family)